jgi:hypothetical protein
MKDSDIKNARRILQLIRQLTAEELSGVEVVNDNPDFNGLPDCMIQYRYWYEGEQIEDYRGQSLLDCLLQAMESNGLKEEPGPDFEPTAEQLRAWMERHDLQGESECRAMASDIRSIELADDPIVHVADTSAPVVAGPGKPDAAGGEFVPIGKE